MAVWAHRHWQTGSNVTGFDRFHREGDHPPGVAMAESGRIIRWATACLDSKTAFRKPSPTPSDAGDHTCHSRGEGEGNRQRDFDALAERGVVLWGDGERDHLSPYRPRSTSLGKRGSAGLRTGKATPARGSVQLGVPRAFSASLPPQVNSTVRMRGGHMIEQRPPHRAGWWQSRAPAFGRSGAGHAMAMPLMAATGPHGGFRASGAARRVAVGITQDLPKGFSIAHRSLRSAALRPP
jgi:hypothetical protein